ncbi:MAG: DUF4382 domain-containing protein [Saprospiraceae bacterium]|nr:DUF4382 domain-containing protein [Saprospiraceae bacterium]
MKKIMLLFVLGASLSFLMSCKKTEDSTKLTVLLTDGPIDAQEVNVEINEVKVNFRDDSTGWVSLSTTPGVYDLLKLQNGVTTPLATGTYPTSNIVKEIRFVLGTKNTIKVKDVVYPLTIPSGGDSGLKIKVGKQLANSLDSLTIDFDAALSIKDDGAGIYKLSPVLKVK